MSSSAGVSVIADGRLQQPSAVYSGTASGSGYHLLVVEGYSRIKHMPNGTSINSRPFMLGGYRWVLDICPNGGCLESADFKSLFLSSHRWGIVKFMKREALEQSEHLKDDCFTIRCDIIIADPFAPFVEVPTSDMFDRFKKILETKVGTDVKFMVDGDTFVAHRCVLAARSAVFMAQLFGPMKEGTKNIVIHIQEMESSVFKALLRFIYTDSLPTQHGGGRRRGRRAQATWLQNLLVAADRYDLQRLKSLCEHQLATVLALAAQQRCHGLKEACLEFLKVQSVAALQAIMATSDWQLMSTTYPCVPNELIAKLASKV